jgi:hypothetical protein
MTKRKARRKIPARRMGFEIVGPSEEADDGFLELSFGGQQVKIHRMNVGSLQALVRLTEPYIKRAVTALISQTGLEKMADKEQVRRALRTVISEQLSEMVVTVPETLVQACACLMNIRPSDEELTGWFMDSVLPTEVLSILQRLDELNDFGSLWDQAVGLWGHFDEKYAFSAGVQEQMSARKALTEDDEARTESEESGKT